MENIADPPKAHNPLGGEHRFQLLLDAVKDYAIYMLDAEGRVASWNTGAQRLKGYSEAEILGRHFGVFYTEADRAAGGPERALRTATDEGRYRCEGWRVRKDGGQFWTSVVIDPVLEDGRLIGFAKVTRDLTESRQKQAEIDAARAHLAQAQKMEAIGRLTGGVAHDFNNLLTVIRSSADLLRRPDLSEERRQRYVTAIAETADRAALVTGQLLAFARRQPLHPEPFAVAERLSGMDHIIATTVGGEIDVSIEVSADVHPVEADANQFEAAILNLVINARDAMAAGGRLTIEAVNTDCVPAVRGHAAADGRFVAITVKDSGSGIASDALSRIFEPFFTTKATNKGTGLGLSQVYGFAKQSGGDVDVVSAPGAGSAFTLYLPRMKAAEERRAGLAVETGPSEPIAPKSVLLVEDNQTIGRFALDLFTELGQTTTWAMNAQAALEILDQRRAEFDLVFSDVVMPGINGIELAEQIRLRWPDLTVVLTSGYSHVLAEEGGHGFEFLQKPYSVDGILRVLRNRPAAPPPPAPPPAPAPIAA